MSEIQKLRALLIEARAAVNWCAGNGRQRVPTETAARVLVDIDAALAEPIATYAKHDVDSCCCPDCCLLRQAQEERDTARAERDTARAERDHFKAMLRERAEALLKAQEEIERLNLGKPAFVRGAEAMREAAALEIDRLLTERKATAIWVGPDEIRAVPIPAPEEK